MAVTACLRLRVSSCLCQTAKELQVAYTNPLYMAQAYRMKDTLAETAAALEKALGKKAEFGSQDGIKPNKLRKYHYMMMPYFTDPVELAAYKTQEEAMQVVEANLAAGKGACSRSAASMCRGRMSRCSG